MTIELLEKNLEQTTVSVGEDDMRQYLEEIRQYPVLTPEQERQIARRCAEGDEEAIRQMVNANLRLVVKVAREYDSRGVPMLDLIQEGSIGLLAAAKKFDHTLDFRFSTYATKWIRQGITRYLMNHGSAIRVPVHTGERMRKLMKAKAEYMQLHGTEASDEDLAEMTGFSVAQVRKLLLSLPEIGSLDSSGGEDNDGNLGASIADPAPQPQQELIRKELNSIMERLLSELTERQQQILRLRVGMEDGECHSLEQISKIIGVSKERVRQIERQALDKLQLLGEDFGLEDFLND